MAAALVSCQKEGNIETQNTLSVTPSAMLEFNAAGNPDVTLSVKTDAESWDFTASEWITASRDGSSLIVNVMDNDTEEERFGRVTVTAGNAKEVKINVHQDAGAAVGGRFECVSESSVFVLDSPEVTASTGVRVVLPAPAESDLVLSVSFDGKYLDEYNFKNKEDHELMPAANVSFSGNLTVKAGETVSNTLDVTLDASGLDFLTCYLVPLQVKSVSGESVISESRVNLVVVRQNARRPVKNVVLFAVNDTNPLNALEFKLDNGEYFFDAVVLFAANINYRSKDDVVYLHNNKNVQALLDESDIYLQPLRKAGIKVYLGLLGNHDQSGLCQLSDWGARQYALDVASACKKYKLDGVMLDDEYSTSPDLSNPWFTEPSEVAGARLCYELKKEMRNACTWPTELSYYELGWLGVLPNVRDQETGEEHTPSEFVDFFVADYYDPDLISNPGGATEPYADLTLANCSFNSFECNIHKGKAVTEDSARQAKAQGYGWCMWYALDHSGSANISRNFNSIVRKYMQATARGCYDSELLDPTHVYHKIGEGKYDPVRHESKANYN